MSLMSHEPRRDRKPRKTRTDVLQRLAREFVMLSQQDAKRMAAAQMRTVCKYICEAHGIAYQGENCPQCVYQGRELMSFDKGEPNHGRQPENTDRHPVVPGAVHAAPSGSGG